MICQRPCPCQRPCHKLLCSSPVGCGIWGKTMGVFETAYLLTTPTNYDVKLSMQNVVSEF